MANIEWKVTRIEAVDKDGLKNVCVQACFDVHGDDNGMKGFAQSDVMLKAPDANNFVDAANVTHDQAVQWVKDALGADGVKTFEDRVLEQIGWQKAPKPKALDLAWTPKDAAVESN